MFGKEQGSPYNVIQFAKIKQIRYFRHPGGSIFYGTIKIGNCKDSG
jgi:hypothetical protein